MATINPPSVAESQKPSAIGIGTIKITRPGTTRTTRTTTPATTLQQNCYRNWSKLNSNQKRVQKRSQHIGNAHQRIIIIIYMMVLTVLQSQQQTYNYGAMAVPLNEIQTETHEAPRGSHKNSPPSLTSSSSASSSSLSWMEMPFYTKRKVRLRKRAHNSINAIYTSEMNNPNMEWSNPCGAIWQEDIAQQQQEQWRRHQHRGQRCTRYKKLLRKLQMKIGPEFRRLRDIQSAARKASPRSPSTTSAAVAPVETVAINIGGMQTWELHNETYNFLPKMESHSNITLRRWHRDLQIYVAAFAYMRRAQVYYDYHKTMQESPVAIELQQLKQNARQMLCNVEIAIIGTNLIYGRYPKHQQKTQTENQSHSNKIIGLKTISRDLMEHKLLGFQTPITQLQHNNAARATTIILDESWSNINIDIRFLKYHYIDYLRSLVRLLRQHTTKKCFKDNQNLNGATTIATASSSSSSSSSSSARKSSATSTSTGGGLATKRRKATKHKPTIETNDIGTSTKASRSKLSSSSASS